ncbi:hypothetical protein ACSBR2_010606 [Camellia fascicularis]
MKLQRLVGKIEFVNVSFYYPSRSMVLLILELCIMEAMMIFILFSLGAPVRNLLNLLSPIREYTCLIFFLISFVGFTSIAFNVGLSGSGKSTLVNLLLRLYEPTSGEILVDGFPLRKLDISWLRDRIGFVGQQDVEWATKQANAHEFISSLPNGYETIVDDGLLSGGQKQRIAIGRAIVRDPAILILDEATSALDAENEYYIARLLHAFINDCRVKGTVIVIAHRSFPVFGLTSSTVGNVKLGNIAISKHQLLYINMYVIIMSHDQGYLRFFAHTNFFRTYMLGLVTKIADHMAACFLPRARLFSLFLCSYYEYSVQCAND